MEKMAFEVGYISLSISSSCLPIRTRRRSIGFSSRSSKSKFELLIHRHGTAIFCWQDVPKASDHRVLDECVLSPFCGDEGSQDSRKPVPGNYWHTNGIAWLRRALVFHQERKMVILGITEDENVPHQRARFY
eukprot:scaffold770_cov109-Cylindrotheca_fusiformis.AAC.8